MPTRFLLRLHGRGFEERYPEATVYGTSNQPLGEATSEAYGGGAWALRTPEFVGHLAFDSPAIRYLSAEAPTPASVEPMESEEEEPFLCGCGSRGWAVFNADPDAGRLGDVQRCDCELLPDDESAYDSASAAGLLVDVDGNVLPQPWGTYAAEARRQRRVEALRQRLTRSGRLLGTCSPDIRFYALGKHVFCDSNTQRVSYSTSLQDFEAMIARRGLPGFRPA
jgi:hypothetical protein